MSRKELREESFKGYRGYDDQEDYDRNDRGGYGASRKSKSRGPRDRDRRNDRSDSYDSQDRNRRKSRKRRSSVESDSLNDRVSKDSYDENRRTKGRTGNFDRNFNKSGFMRTNQREKSKIRETKVFEGKNRDWKPLREDSVKINNFMRLCSYILSKGFNIHLFENELKVSNIRQFDQVKQFLIEKLTDQHVKQFRLNCIDKDKDLKDEVRTEFDDETGELKEDIDKCMLDFATDKLQFGRREFFERVYIEIAKFNQLSRIYTTIGKQMKKRNMKNVRELIEKFHIKIVPHSSGKDNRKSTNPDFDQISCINFFRMIEKLGIIDAGKMQDIEYLFEEYAQWDETLVRQTIKESSNKNKKEKAAEMLDKLKLGLNRAVDERMGGSKDEVEDEDLEEENRQLKSLKEKKIKIKMSFITIKELQDDYVKFETDFFPMIDNAVLFEIDKYCKQFSLTLIQIFFKKYEKNLAIPDLKKNDDELELEASASKKQQFTEEYVIEENLHSYKLYEISNKLREQDQYRDCKNLMGLFVLRHQDLKRQINFIWLYDLGRDARLFDQREQVVFAKGRQLDIEAKIRELNKSQYYHDNKGSLAELDQDKAAVKKFLETEGHYQEMLNQKIDEYNQEILIDCMAQFVSDKHNYQKFIRKNIDDFHRDPKQVYEQLKVQFQIDQPQICHLRAGQVMTIIEKSFFDGKSFESVQLQNLVEEKAAKLIQKIEMINKINTSLGERGFSIEMVLERILGMKDIRGGYIQYKELKSLIQVLNIDVSETQIQNFFSCFVKTNQQYVKADIFAQEVNASKTKKSDNMKLMKISNRKQFTEAEQLKDEFQTLCFFIGKKIDDQGLVNFGPLLKGHDFNDDDHIDKLSFFQVMKSYKQICNPEDGLKEGDILFLMEKFASGSELINLADVKHNIDNYISTAQHKILLKSSVKKLFEDRAIDSDSDQGSRMKSRNRSRDVSHVPVEINKPEGVEHFVLDFLCNVYQKDDQDLGKVIKRYGSKLDLDSFESLVYSDQGLNYSSSSLSKYFQYFIDKQKVDLLDKNFDFSNEDLISEVNNYIYVKNFDGLLFEELGPKYAKLSNKRNALEKVILEKIAKYLGTRPTPFGLLEEIIDDDRLINTKLTPVRQGARDELFDETEIWITEENFTDQVLGNTWRLQDELTQSMRTILKIQFITNNMKVYNHINIIEFIQDLQDTAKTYNHNNAALIKKKKLKQLKIYRRDDEISQANVTNDEDLPEDQKPSLKKPSEPKHKTKGKKDQVEIERDIYESRTQANTFLNYVDPDVELNITQVQRPFFVEIMQRTRALGICVEQYFQIFCHTHQKNMNLQLNFEQFQKAIKGLHIQWALDEEQVEEIFLAVQGRGKDGRFEKEVTLEMIANAILSCVNQRDKEAINQYEETLLDVVYRHLENTNQITTLNDTIKVINFRRDYTGTMREIIHIFKTYFQIDANYCGVEDWQLRFLLQRYTDPTFTTDELEKQKQGFKSMMEMANAREVQFIKFVAEVGMLTMGIPVDFLKFAKVAERINKAIDIEAVKRNQPVQMQYELERIASMSDRDDIIDIKSWLNFCHSIKVDEYIDSTELKEFLYIIAEPVAEHKKNNRRNYNKWSRSNTPSQSDDDVVGEHFYMIDEIVRNTRKIFKKSKETMFQDTLNQIFLESKRMDLSQSMLTVFTEVDLYDGKKSGFISQAQFVDALIGVCGFSSEDRIDFMHLAEKYREKDDFGNRDAIVYEKFYEDYLEIEHYGLSGKIFGLPEQSKSGGKGSREQVEKDRIFRFEISDEQLKFYAAVKKWMLDPKKGRKGNKKQDLIKMFVLEDSQQSGFLTPSLIKQFFYDVGMDLTNKQLKIMIFSLHQDADCRSVSWPELVELIFGPDEWHQVKKQYHLSGDNMNTNLEIDLGSTSQGILDYSQEFVISVEFMYDELRALSEEYQSPMQTIDKNDLFSMIAKLNLKPSQDDTRRINSWIRDWEISNRNSFTLEEFFIEIKATKLLVRPKQNLRDYFKNQFNNIRAHENLKQNFYSVAEFGRYCQAVGFSSTNYHTPQDIEVPAFIETKRKSPLYAIKTIFKAVRVLKPDWEVKEKDGELLSKKQIIYMINLPPPLRDPAAEQSTLVKQKEEQKKKESSIEYIDMTINAFRKHIMGNEEREDVIRNQVAPRVTVKQFVNICKQIGFKLNQEKQDILVNQYQHRPKEGETQTPEPMVSIKRIKVQLEIKDKPKPPPVKDSPPKKVVKFDSKENLEDSKAPSPQKEQAKPSSSESPSKQEKSDAKSDNKEMSTIDRGEEKPLIKVTDLKSQGSSPEPSTRVAKSDAKDKQLDIKLEASKAESQSKAKEDPKAPGTKETLQTIEERDKLIIQEDTQAKKVTIESNKDDKSLKPEATKEVKPPVKSEKPEEVKKPEEKKQKEETKTSSQVQQPKTEIKKTEKKEEAKKDDKANAKKEAVPAESAKKEGATVPDKKDKAPVSDKKDTAAAASAKKDTATTSAKKEEVSASAKKDAAPTSAKKDAADPKSDKKETAPVTDKKETATAKPESTAPAKPAETKKEETKKEEPKKTGWGIFNKLKK